MEIEMDDILCKFINDDLTDLDTLPEETKEETKTEQREPITKIELKHIIQFLKDMFPQYDEDILTIIYNYTTNLDETIIKLMEMNKEFDIEQLIDISNTKTTNQTNLDKSNNSNKSLLSGISSRLNTFKVNRGVKYQLLE